MLNSFFSQIRTSFLKFIVQTETGDCWPCFNKMLSSPLTTLPTSLHYLIHTSSCIADATDLRRQILVLCFVRCLIDSHSALAQNANHCTHWFLSAVGVCRAVERQCSLVPLWMTSKICCWSHWTVQSKIIIPKIFDFFATYNQFSKIKRI